MTAAADILGKAEDAHRHEGASSRPVRKIALLG